MFDPEIAVLYVEGYQINGHASDWSNIRSDGVDEICVGSDTVFTHSSAQSVYWLYQDNNTWVMGGGPLGYGSLAPEVVFAESGNLSRSIDFAPDLPHIAVKLGWWWING